MKYYKLICVYIYNMFVYMYMYVCIYISICVYMSIYCYLTHTYAVKLYILT